MSYLVFRALLFGGWQGIRGIVVINAVVYRIIDIRLSCTHVCGGVKGYG